MVLSISQVWPFPFVFHRRGETGDLLGGKCRLRRSYRTGLPVDEPAHEFLIRSSFIALLRESAAGVTGLARRSVVQWEH